MPRRVAVLSCLLHACTTPTSDAAVGGGPLAGGAVVPARGPSPPASALPAPVEPAPLPIARTKEADQDRLRLGFDLIGGVGAGGGASGRLFGATAHAGWQLDRRIAVYARGSMFGWFSSTKRSADRSGEASGVIGWQLTPLFALMPGDRFEIAAGPSLDRLNTMRSSFNTSSRTVTSSGDPVTLLGTYLGLNGRVALHIGGMPSPGTGRRASFTIGADLHPTFVEGSVLTFLTLGVGADWY